LTQLDLGLKKIGKRAEALPRKGFIPSLDDGCDRANGMAPARQTED